MLVYSDAVYIDNNFYLYSSHSVASNLRWKTIAGVRTRCWMDITLYRCPTDTVVDADCDAEESEIAVHAGT